MNQNLATQLKKMREQAGISQNFLAKEADVSVAFISKFEAGQYQTLSLDVCKQLANGLKLTLRDFLINMGLLEDESTPNTTLLLQNALRGSGFSISEAKKVVDYADYIKNHKPE